MFKNILRYLGLNRNLLQTLKTWCITVLKKLLLTLGIELPSSNAPSLPAGTEKGAGESKYHHSFTCEQMATLYSLLRSPDC